MARRAEWDRISRIVVVALSGFAALTAIGGGLEMVLYRHGNAFVPTRLLEHTPFASFVIPGLVLAIVVGGLNLACVVLVWARSRGAIDTAISAGGALAGWIAAELSLTRSFHPMHGLFGAVGLGVLGLGVRAAWRSRVARHRWTVAVTAGAWLGFLVPASVAAVVVPSDLSALAKIEIVAAAGLAEGFLLGLSQAWVFPLEVHRLRYATYTALAAALVWVLAMATMAMGHADVPPAVVAAAILVTVIVGLAAMGLAQWVELRHFSPVALEWVGWTALAWVLAIPWSFLPGALVDASTPPASAAVLWALGGLAMAHVLARVTWLGVRRLVATHTGLYDDHPSVRRPTASVMPAA